MRYLTKQWYELSQQQDLHFGLEADARTITLNEQLYQELYHKKEQEFVEMEHEVYDCDPRAFLEEDGAVFVPAEKFVKEEELNQEDCYIYHMPESEKTKIREKIEEFDQRPPFDEDEAKDRFHQMQEDNIGIREKELKKYGLLNKVADIRVFTLGYCTADVLDDLTIISQKNREEVQRISNLCCQAAREEKLPKDLSEKFGWHDCTIIEVLQGKDLTLRFDCEGGFTHYDTVTFVDATVLKMEEPVKESIWIYNELYRIEDGYEVHMLLWGEGMPEITVQCKDIVIESTAGKQENCFTRLDEE